MNSIDAGCEKAKGLACTRRILRKDNLPAHLPHRLPFMRWLLHLCGVKLVQVLKKPPRKTDLDPEAGRICWWHRLVAHLGCDRWRATLYLQEESGVVKATGILEQRDLECTKPASMTVQVCCGERAVLPYAHVLSTLKHLSQWTLSYGINLESVGKNLL